MQFVHLLIFAFHIMHGVVSLASPRYFEFAHPVSLSFLAIDYHSVIEEKKD